MGDITIKHLAETLNVSIATISKALRDSHDISQSTKMRVFDLAKSLNYRPNPFASSLRRQKSNTIAVILPEIADNFFGQAINGIEEVARKMGYHLLIYLSHDSTEREAFFINDILSRCVDGLLISVSYDGNDFTHLDEIQGKLPTVFFDRTYDGSLLHVTNNDYDSAFKATKHLIDGGCRDIAYLAGLQSLNNGCQRFKGYSDALRHHGISFRQELVADCSNNKDENEALLLRMFKNERPDGVVSSMEKLAKLCYHVCNELNIAIPADVKIISFSNFDCASLLNPSLTTITQQAFEMGAEAARMLFKVLKNSNYEAESKVVDAQMFKRMSTA